MMAELVRLGHGSGGRLSHELVRRLFIDEGDHEQLRLQNDSATLSLAGVDLAFTSDSFVVSPHFFPGGDIGKLAVCGTVNDLAVAGAQPLYLSTAYILEEGFPLESLQQIAASVRETAAAAGVAVVTGDTKVVERGKADGVFLTTAGVGAFLGSQRPAARQIRPGDVVLVNGPLGDHGIAVLGEREGISFGDDVLSDVAPLGSLVAAMMAAGEVHAMRDPTRGGLASVLNEFATQAEVKIELLESQLPIRESVRAACAILGYDPLYVANEGKVVAVVPEGAASAILAAMRQHPLGRQACEIGRVLPATRPLVTLRTTLGVSRIVDMLSGELLPRIC